MRISVSPWVVLMAVAVLLAVPAVLLDGTWSTLLFGLSTGTFAFSFATWRARRDAERPTVEAALERVERRKRRGSSRTRT